MKTQRKVLATLVAAALASPAALAAPVLFDADGPGGDPAVTIGTLDWGPTSFVATDIVDITVGDTFSVYTHATLIGTLAPNGTPNTPAGLAGPNPRYEVTMIASFKELVTGVAVLPNQAIATFTALPLEASFLQIYYDDTPDAIQVSGSGFNDGRLILDASGITASNGLFSVDLNVAPAVLDQTLNGDDYPGQLTVTGQGSQGNIAIDHIDTDPAFFQTVLALFGIEFANISQALPFISVDPSDCFTTAPNAVPVGTVVAASGCNPVHVLGPYAVQGASVAPGYTPAIGPVNGAAGNGPDFVAQTDFNSPLEGVVPEPATLALLGLGLGGLGMSGRLRRRAR